MIEKLVRNCPWKSQTENSFSRAPLIAIYHRFIYRLCRGLMEYQSTQSSRDKAVIDVHANLIDGCLLIYQRSPSTTGTGGECGKKCESDCMPSLIQATLPASTLTLTKNGRAEPVSLYKSPFENHEKRKLCPINVVAFQRASFSVMKKCSPEKLAKHKCQLLSPLRR